MFTCRQLSELLCDFIANDLSPEQRCLLEEHLKDCPPCMVYVETYQVTIKLSGKLPQAPLPPALQARLQAVLDEFKKQG